jgi:hypothetical protein
MVSSSFVRKVEMPFKSAFIIWKMSLSYKHQYVFLFLFSWIVFMRRLNYNTNVCFYWRVVLSELKRTQNLVFHNVQSPIILSRTKWLWLWHAKKQERKLRPDYLPLINSPKRNFYLCHS